MVFLRKLVKKTVMNPESRMFRQVYQDQLAVNVEGYTFNENVVGTLGAIEDHIKGSPEWRDMPDSSQAAYAVTGSSLPDKEGIARSLHTEETTRKTQVQLSGPYDPFEHKNIECTSRLARVDAVNHSTGSPYRVYRIVVAPTNQTTLPDCQGIYIARDKSRRSCIVFTISQDGETSAASNPTYRATEITHPEDRKTVISELDKALLAARQAD
jgi:hypothetical protein